MADRNKPGKRDKGAPGPFEALRALKEDMKKREEAAKALPATPPKKAPSPLEPEPYFAPLPPSASTSTSEDDALVMHRLFAGVQPLDRSKGRLPKQRIDRSPIVEKRADERVEAARADAEAVHAHLRNLVEGGARFEVEDDGKRVEGRRVELPMDVLRKLRRGSLPIDARLDLHGFTAEQARGQLETFLRTMRTRGERCVLVIHGKGEHSPHGTGILRGEIGAWLSQGTASESVAAFATAASSDGGEGAVYVLLRR